MVVPVKTVLLLMSVASSSLVARVLSCVAGDPVTHLISTSKKGSNVFLSPSLFLPSPPLSCSQASHVVILLAKKYPNYKIVNFDKLVSASSQPYIS